MLGNFPKMMRALATNDTWRSEVKRMPKQEAQESSRDAFAANMTMSEILRRLDENKEMILSLGKGHDDLAHTVMRNQSLRESEVNALLEELAEVSERVKRLEGVSEVEKKKREKRLKGILQGIAIVVIYAILLAMMIALPNCHPMGVP